MNNSGPRVFVCLQASTWPRVCRRGPRVCKRGIFTSDMKETDFCIKPCETFHDSIHIREHWHWESHPVWYSSGLNQKPVSVSKRSDYHPQECASQHSGACCAVSMPISMSSWQEPMTIINAPLNVLLIRAWQPLSFELGNWWLPVSSRRNVIRCWLKECSTRPGVDSRLVGSNLRGEPHGSSLHSHLVIILRELSRERAFRETLPSQQC